MRNGLIVAAIHVLLALGTAGKYLYERESLPRAWARTAPYDPNLPIRGRYVRIAVEVEPVNVAGDYASVQLAVSGGKLTGTPVSEDGQSILRRADGRYQLSMPLAFFIAEHVPDPSIRAAGEELWVEVSVPRKGPPRPVRLGVKRGGGAIEALP